MEEFEDRVAEAWRARFASDLWHALRALPVDGPSSARREKSTSAVVSVVLGILSLCLFFVSFGLLFFLTLPLSVTAWALGREARRAGTRTAGEALGVAGTALSLLVFAGCAALVT